MTSAGWKKLWQYQDITLWFIAHRKGIAKKANLDVLPKWRLIPEMTSSDNYSRGTPPIHFPGNPPCLVLILRSCSGYICISMKKEYKQNCGTSPVQLLPYQLQLHSRELPVIIGIWTLLCSQVNQTIPSSREPWTASEDDPPPSMVFPYTSNPRKPHPRLRGLEQHSCAIYLFTSWLSTNRELGR